LQERQDLIRQWEDAQEQMRRNDDAIQAATQLFADKKVHIKDRQAKLDIAAKMLDDELVNNKEREAQIDVLNREIEQVHSNYSAEQVRFGSRQQIQRTHVKTCKWYRDQLPVLK
jgi:hypothetical protein